MTVTDESECVEVNAPEGKYWDRDIDGRSDNGVFTSLRTTYGVDQFDEPLSLRERRQVALWSAMEDIEFYGPHLERDD